MLPADAPRIPMSRANSASELLCQLGRFTQTSRPLLGSNIHSDNLTDGRWSMIVILECQTDWLDPTTGPQSIEIFKFQSSHC